MGRAEPGRRPLSPGAWPTVPTTRSTPADSRPDLAQQVVRLVTALGESDQPDWAHRCLQAVRDYLSGGVDQLAHQTGMPFAQILDWASQAAREDWAAWPAHGADEAFELLGRIPQIRIDLADRQAEAHHAGRSFPDPTWRA